MKTEREIRRNVMERAGACPGCGWEPEPHQVLRSEGEYEVHYGLSCYECSWQYEDDRRTWFKPTPPGEENPRVKR